MQTVALRSHSFSTPFVFLLRPNSLSLYLLDRVTIRRCVSDLGDAIVAGDAGNSEFVMGQLGMHRSGPSILYRPRNGCYIHRVPIPTPLYHPRSTRVGCDGTRLKYEKLRVVRGI